MVSGVFLIPLDAHHSAAKLPSSKSNSAALPLREYIADAENPLVRIAAEAAFAPGSATNYNPLVLVGPTGTGKSELARGIVRRWKHAHEHRKSLKVTGADFARNYASAVDTDSMPDFRDRFRRVELLLLDDVQELAGKDAAQNELSRILDDLTSRGRLVVVTSHQLPAETACLCAALASRLSAGLTVPLTAPGSAARREILQRLTSAHEVSFSRDALEILADGLPATVPQLNHAIVTIRSELPTGQHEVNAKHVRQFLQRLTETQKPALRDITARVARYFQIKTSDLKGTTRRQAVVQARGVAMYLARRLTDKSLLEVGRHFGGRDHTTVLHACRKTESSLQTHSTTSLAISELLRQYSAVNATREAVAN